MKLRYLLLFTTAIGACGSLLLGADMYRRMQDAEGLITLNNLPLRQDSVLVFGMPHTIGLISLAFLFLALFLLLIMALRDPVFQAALANQKVKLKQAAPDNAPIITSTPIAVAAAQVPDVGALADSPVAAPALQAETREVQNALAAAPAFVESTQPMPILAFEVPVPPSTPTPPAVPSPNPIPPPDLPGTPQPQQPPRPPEPVGPPQPLPPPEPPQIPQPPAPPGSPQPSAESAPLHP